MKLTFENPQVSLENIADTEDEMYNLMNRIEVGLEDINVLQAITNRVPKRGLDASAFKIARIATESICARLDIPEVTAVATESMNNSNIALEDFVDVLKKVWDFIIGIIVKLGKTLVKVFGNSKDTVKKDIKRAKDIKSKGKRAKDIKSKGKKAKNNPAPSVPASATAPASTTAPDDDGLYLDKSNPRYNKYLQVFSSVGFQSGAVSEITNNELTSIDVIKYLVSGASDASKEILKIVESLTDYTTKEALDDSTTVDDIKAQTDGLLDSIDAELMSNVYGILMTDSFLGVDNIKPEALTANGLEADQVDYDKAGELMLTIFGSRVILVNNRIKEKYSYPRAIKINTSYDPSATIPALTGPELDIATDSILDVFNSYATSSDAISASSKSFITNTNKTAKVIKRSIESMASYKNIDHDKEALLNDVYSKLKGLADSSLRFLNITTIFSVDMAKQNGVILDYIDDSTGANKGQG